MKQISLPKSAFLALLQSGTCTVKKPVAKSPAVGPGSIECDWFFDADSYGYENTNSSLYGFYNYNLRRRWVFPWGGPAEKVQIKGTARVAEITAVEVRPARKRYYWVITLKLF